MKTEVVKLSQIKTNAANPRQIRDEKFAKLVNSVLIFPKMLEIRPIVVDNTFTSLGGNMRYRALSFIAEQGVALYNELILIETGASTALRAARYMESRKIAKMHQNVLVFYKGKTKNIAKTFPKIEFTKEEEDMFSNEMSEKEEECYEQISKQKTATNKTVPA